ncbi:MAG: hypothetical protein J7604_00785 [Sporocytophaga sp.]|uniref:hypothetical protein n=1 Tax=Sporocytophaga sp. TaxID=2231183 RepID=UPI001B2186E7|nr:hypothetical protein [Sporocytophaga sp.]MBO9698706.1 hypothetical protein [Sporocytophaga sp.]
MNSTQITRDNVEEWLFEYCEGTLTDEEKLNVEAFISQNPEYREELSFWEDSYLPQLSASPLPPEAQQLLKTNYFHLKFSTLFKCMAVLSALSFILILYFKSHNEGSKSQQKSILKTDKHIRHSENPAVPEKRQLETLRIVKADNPKSEILNTKIVEKIQENNLKVSDIAISPDSASVEPGGLLPKLNNEITDEYTREAPVANPLPADQTEKKELGKNNITKAKLSPSQRRKVAREIRKAQDLKEQEQLMNGNKPYIVPSDETMQ